MSDEFNAFAAVFILGSVLGLLLGISCGYAWGERAALDKEGE